MESVNTTKILKSNLNDNEIMYCESCGQILIDVCKVCPSCRTRFKNVTVDFNVIIK